jgi:hypothetical protein
MQDSGAMVAESSGLNKVVGEVEDVELVRCVPEV